MKSIGTLATATMVMFGLGASASAQVYKYKSKNGTVVFTDKLSELPKERRAYYNRKQAEEEQKRRQERERMTAEERRAADLDAERERLMAAEIEETERAERLRAIDEALASYRKNKQEEAQKRAFWTQKKVDGQKRLEEALAAYRAAREEYEGLAVRARFSLFPGQRARLAELEALLPELEAAVDAANTYLTETLPTQARRAGVPPGWLR